MTEQEKKIKVGCMVLSMPVYPLTCSPDDVIAAMKENHKWYRRVIETNGRSLHDKEENICHGT